MKKTIFLLVSILVIPSLFAQKGIKKSHPMSMHFGWRDQGITRVTFGYPGIYTKNLKNEVPMGYNGPFDMSRNFSGMIEMFMPINIENQYGIGTTVLRDGLNKYTIVNISYGATVPCNLFYNIFQAKLCGVYQLGPSMRFRKFDQAISSGKYETIDPGISLSFTGTNRKTALKTSVHAFTSGPVIYDVMIYKHPKKGVLVGAGILRNRPNISLGTMFRKTRISLDGAYDLKHQNASVEAKLVLVIEYKDDKKS